MREKTYEKVAKKLKPLGFKYNPDTHKFFHEFTGVTINLDNYLDSPIKRILNCYIMDNIGGFAVKEVYRKGKQTAKKEIEIQLKQLLHEIKRKI